MKVNELPYDVYKIEDRRLELKTSYFQKYCNYVLKSTDVETGAVSYEKLAEVEDF